MDGGSTGLRWGVERRLEFIEFRLFWDGAINRADLIEFFGVSVPQASKDLTLYQERAPGNLIYDKSEKRYVATPEFEPRFLNPDPDQYLARLRSLADGLTTPAESWIGQPPAMDVALTPRRDIDAAVLREILRATRESWSVEIRYQSMNRERPNPVWRRVTPHAFAYDGFRWHTRAYCHMENRFKDFLLPRALGVRNPGPPGARGADDRFWYEYFEIIIAPHPKLTESQQAVVAKDYGLRGGKGTLSVRYAMLFYVLKRLGLIGDAEKEDPRRQHIVALNKKDAHAALNRVSSSLVIERSDV